MNIRRSALLIMLALLFMPAICTVPVLWQVILFGAFLVCVQINFARAGPLHPGTWFSVFSFLYAVNYPLFMLTSGQESLVSSWVVPLNFLTLVGFLFGVTLSSRERFVAPALPLSAGALRVVILALLPVCLVLLVIVPMLGVTSKREFLMRTSELGIAPLFLLFQVITIAYIAYSFRLIKTSGSGRGLQHSFFTGLGICVLFVLLLGVGVTGERDLVLRCGLLVYLCLGAIGRGPKYRFWHFMAIGLVGLYAVRLLEGLKGLLLNLRSPLEGANVGSIFFNEFASAGRNLDYILSTGIVSLHGETYLWGILRYFDFLFPEATSATEWFNVVVRNNFGDGGTSGWGFSMVAEAYINFGFGGVFVAGLLIGLLTAVLYFWARKSGFGFIFYLMFVPTLIYVLRADLGYLLSSAFKVNIIICGGVWLLATVLDALVKRSRQPVCDWRKGQIQ